MHTLYCFAKDEFPRLNNDGGLWFDEWSHCVPAEAYRETIKDWLKDLSLALTERQAEQNSANAQSRANKP